APGARLVEDVLAVHDPSARIARVGGAFAPTEVRRAFPILGRALGGRPLAYLDSAATAQKPDAVLEAEARFYRAANAAVHRGVHTLSDEATRAYEGARERVRRFLGAREAREVVFARGATEAINLVARSVVRPG